MYDGYIFRHGRKGYRDFMDDFSVYVSSFDNCLANLELVLKRCEESHLVLNWEKCHFMVNEGIVLGHKISSKGIEVDWAKISTIENLPPSVSVKGVRSFLGHAGFYRRFIKDFFKILKPLSTLLMNGVPFDFDEKCRHAFKILKEKLTFAPIVNFATTEKELLAIVLVFDKFRPYLIGNKNLTWRLGIKKGMENFVADHLSRLELEESQMPPEMSKQQLKKFYSVVKRYYWEKPILYKHCAYQIIRRCVPEDEMVLILTHCGGHFKATRSAAKVLQCGYYCPTLMKDVNTFVKACDRCQRVSSISRRDEMPLLGILEVELFDVWGIDYMGPFPSSYNNKYILLAVDYVSKWVEAAATPTNDSKVVLKFSHKHIFTRFGTPRALISDKGSHFCNKMMDAFLDRYGVHHRIAMPYHPQANGQTKLSNREVKNVLEKTINRSRRD
ncbi:uncharacterized protein LOC133806233 [Humulus lupulus]|uniref:uncharacterized protein LOC133806233 n=1 Tax=Humulus lupulus TaxID=3486 RepID=UPI002B4054BF|nr:uncharacterized protein LOC133806233 [Humulus lupulus]